MCTQMIQKEGSDKIVQHMQVQRLFEQVKDRRVLIELPSEFNDRRVEINVLTIDESFPTPIHCRSGQNLWRYFEKHARK